MSEQDEAPQEEREPPRLHIVGIGASAGGLDAVTQLLRRVKLDSTAFVVVQHLAPTHESALAPILARQTPIPVVTITDAMKVEPNHVYVLPPNANVAILHGVLHLMPPPKQAPRLPIDFFFRSLAQDQGAGAVGVVLSGTGSDGTFGLKAIKEAGGIAFVQEPSTAKFDGMPKSAIESGWADVVLPPENIADELMRIDEHRWVAHTSRWSKNAHDTVAKLIVKIRERFGNDLTYYKPTTIERRVERRMALHKLERVEDYVKLATEDEAELAHIYRDILIGVTSFFRDEEPWEALKHVVLDPLFKGKEAGGTFRAWVPGCATGEEAYSLAIILLEHLGNAAADHRIQIFGTDVDERSIQSARSGSYPENIALDVSEERLRRFFVKHEGGWRVSRRVRDMLVFSTQNVAMDAPFSRLDLVCCRNLFIYLQPTIQKRVLRLFHYALVPTGHLMMGTSETIGDAPDLFSLVDRKNKIYANKNIPSASAFDAGFGTPGTDSALPLPRTPMRVAPTLASVAERKILDLYAPPGVIVNEAMEIVHFRGRTGPYLEPVPGVASLNVLKLARAELHVELRRVIARAFQENVTASARASITVDGKANPVRLEAIPIAEPDTGARCVLVLFHARVDEDDGETAKAAVPPANAQEQRMRDLEQELVLNKEYLQSMVEELESANEELKSSNEELQSSNEELQSTNEELETSKEELQSSNEALTTVNDELQARITDQQQANDDLHNVLSAASQAAVIVGTDLHIRRFTPLAQKLLSLGDADVGQPVSSLDRFFADEHLEPIVRDAISALRTVDKKAMSSQGAHFALRIAPYKTVGNIIAGAVIMLTPAGDPGAK